MLRKLNALLFPDDLIHLFSMSRQLLRVSLAEDLFTVQTCTCKRPSQQNNQKWKH